MVRHDALTMTTPQPMVQPDGKRLRRKLQKINAPKQNNPITTTGAKLFLPQPFNKSALNLKKPESTFTTPRTVTALPLPSDLTDARWVEYVHACGDAAKEVRRSARESQVNYLQSQLVPEFAHLRFDDTNSTPLNIRPALKSSVSEYTKPALPIARPSISTSRSEYFTKPAIPPTRPALVSASSESTIRRFAKTPILRIGQREEIPPVPDSPIERRDSNATVGDIADSYKALLSSNLSFVSSRYSQSVMSWYCEDPFELESHLSSYDLPSVMVSVPKQEPPAGTSASCRDNVLEVPQEPHVDAATPLSEAGTMVGHEEEKIYFKPLSMESTPESASPRPARSRDPRDVISRLSVTPEDPSLQICFDLLTKELSSAISANSTVPGNETASLQIWAMIEAYEKLRDQLRQTGKGDEQTRSMMTIFDTWLRALYAVHDEMTGDDGLGSENDYGGVVFDGVAF